MSEDLKSHIGARVKQARKAKKLTQAEVADRLGKAVETISNIERGASWTSLEMLENLSKLLDERVEVFFEGYVRAKRKSQTRLQLEAELAGLLRDLDEDKLRVVRAEVTGKCAPEDVGGFPGYYEFLDAMADPKHPEHQHLKDWYGGTFDPNQPETDELKLEVLKLAKRWKPRNPRK